MTSTITTAVGRVLNSGNPREVPRFTQHMIFEKTILKELGTTKGRAWFDWGDMKLEVEENGEPIDWDSPAIAEIPYYKVWRDDGGYMLQPLKAFVRGTYAERVAVREAAKRLPSRSVRSMCSTGSPC